jgi:predicted Zn finger-like uncharacterized protein
MVVLCPNCRKAIAVPPEKRDVPGLKGRCGGCKTVFVVADALMAPASPPPTPTIPPVALGSSSPAAGSSAAPSETRGTPPAAPTPRVSRPASGRAPLRLLRQLAPLREPSTVKSESVCPNCKTGFCKDCAKKVGTAVVCPDCDGLCRPTSEQDAAERRVQQRTRSMQAELGTILAYPLVDGLAYFLLAAVVCVFVLAGKLSGYAVLFSKGLLMAYAFQALNMVARGNLRSYMPEISDITDLRRPVFLGFVAFLISSGPLSLLLFVGAKRPTRPGCESSRGSECLVGGD